MKVSYVVTLDTGELVLTPEQAERVRQMIQRRTQADAGDWHITITQQKGLPLHPFPTP